MIGILGEPKAACDGVTRREAFRIGGLSLLGVTLADILRAERAAPAAPRGRARSAILLYLFGGPSLQETFDPKPDAPLELRGEFGSTPTSVPGVHFCEHLPQMARWMHRSTLIRSATHDQNDHSAGLLYTLSGTPPKKLESLVPILPTQAPGINSTIQYLARNERRALPASVWMPCCPGWGQSILRPGPYAGALGRRHDPLFTSCELEETYQAKDFYDVRPSRGRVVVPGTELHRDITLERFRERRGLLGELERQTAGLFESETCRRFDDHHRRALEILTDTSSSDNPWRAFDLEEEPVVLRERYGESLYGRAALVARRLVERGVRLVTVAWECFDKVGGDPTAWDTHERHFPILRDHRLPVLDRVYSALCEDLDARGLLDETLVVVMGEMGRSPKVNAKGGRDHWSYCHNVLLTGAGVKPGYVHGSSDATGNRPDSDSVGPAELIATIYAAMGIDTSLLLEEEGGRVRPIINGEPIGAVLA